MIPYRVWSSPWPRLYLLSLQVQPVSSAWKLIKRYRGVEPKPSPSSAFTPVHLPAWWHRSAVLPSIMLAEPETVGWTAWKLAPKSLEPLKATLTITLIGLGPVNIDSYHLIFHGNLYGSYCTSVVTIRSEQVRYIFVKNGPREEQFSWWFQDWNVLKYVTAPSFLDFDAKLASWVKLQLLWFLVSWKLTEICFCVESLDPHRQAPFLCFTRIGQWGKATICIIG